MKNDEEYQARRMARYQEEDTDGKLAIRLQEISRTMRSLHARKGSQQRVLTMLNEAGTITQRELTERLGIQSASASEVLAKLENLGLIVRSPSEEDRRTTNIVLTSEGRRQAEEAGEQRRKRRGEMFSALTGEEKAQLLALLEKVSADWGERCREDHGRRSCRAERRHRHEECGEGRRYHAERSEGRRYHEERNEGDRRREEQGEGREHGERRQCSHDCEHCEHPCGRGRKQLAGGNPRG